MDEVWFEHPSDTSWTWAHLEYPEWDREDYLSTSPLECFKKISESDGNMHAGHVYSCAHPPSCSKWKICHSHILQLILSHKSLSSELVGLFPHLWIIGHAVQIKNHSWLWIIPSGAIDSFLSVSFTTLCMYWSFPYLLISPLLDMRIHYQISQSPFYGRWHAVYCKKEQLIQVESYFFIG